jgi:group I intron endonuclease
MSIISGVYQINCSANSKFYIGSSYSIKKRISQHFSALRRNKHDNAHLQSAWNLYGETCFSFEVLEETLSDQPILFEREQYWLDLKQPYNREVGFNRSSQAIVCKDNAFFLGKDYVVIDPSGHEQLISNLERFSLENGLDKSSLHKVASGEAYQYKGWYCRHASDTHEDWLAKRKRGKKSGAYSGSWKITFTDDSEIEVDSFYKWMKDNGHSRGTLHSFLNGKVAKYKNFKTVERI